MNEEIKVVRQFIEAMPDNSTLTMEERRAQADKAAAAMHLPRGCSVEEVNAGVPAEWVKTAEAGRGKAILYLHGGGYVGGSPISHRQMVGYISRAAGANSLSIAYRLAPEHTCPAAVEDAAAAYRWLIKQGFSPNKIAIAGDSAGGGLTVAALLHLREAGDPLPAAGMCISPWADLTCSSETYRTRAAVDPMIKPDSIAETAALYLGGLDPKTPAASPIFGDLTGLPPLLIQVGNDEVLLGDSIALDKKAKACGVTCSLEIWADMVHVWHMFSPILKEGREAIAKMGDFYRERTA